MKCDNCMREYTKGRAKFCPYCGSPYHSGEPKSDKNDSAAAKSALAQDPELGGDDVWKDFDPYADELIDDEEEEAEIRRMNKRFIITESILAALALALTAAIIYITLKQ